MMRRWIGLDINGWQDMAARDWDADDDRIAPLILNGGVRGVAVQLLDGNWVGGPQAILAPHGRGHGWGNPLGDASRRVQISTSWDGVLSGSLLTGAPLAPKAVSASVEAMSRGADAVMLLIPDHSAIDEAAQARVLHLFNRHRRAHRLLWRPVAAFLDALERGRIGRNQIGKKFRFLIHSGDGLEVQILRLRTSVEHPTHLAPERDGSGYIACRAFGLAVLEQTASKAISDLNALALKDGDEQSSMGMRLLSGFVKPGETEVLRLKSTSWKEITAPALVAHHLFPEIELRGSDFGDDDIEATFLLTPLCQTLAEAMAASLKPAMCDLELLPWGALARGALLAGRIVDRGLPHYFDKLTPIGLAVMERDEPEFVDLVGTDSTVAANREYVSPRYDLTWPSGKREMEFYVLKGTSELRHWTVSMVSAPGNDARVELQLRQTPGQSWAHLALTSAEWSELQRSPIHLDWQRLTPIDASPADVLAKLRKPPPTVPLRVVEDADLEFWTGSYRFSGLESLLANAETNNQPSPDDMVPLLRASKREFAPGAGNGPSLRLHPVGTDGQLPKGLSSDVRGSFDRLINSITTELESAATGKIAPFSTNARVLCVTWIFTRCPVAVQEILVDALECDLRNRRHAMLAPPAARKALVNGAGRSVTGTARLRRLLSVLASMTTNTDTMAATAAVLSRREEAPQALTRALVEKISAKLSFELAEICHGTTFKIRFKNALLTIGGLFRFREIEPYALMSARDPVAASIEKHLRLIDAKLRKLGRRVPQVDEKRKLISSLIELLNGVGDPNILRRIEEEDGDGRSDGED